MALKIILVDDQQLFLESLKIVLENHSETKFYVVGTANNGAEALEIVDELKPDVILMDVRMPIMDGVETTKILKARYPTLPIILLTTFEDDDYVRQALSYGASGYLLKNIPTRELFSAIEAAYSGAVSLDPRVVPNLIGNKPRPELAESSDENDHEWMYKLNRKEKQIVGMIVQGLNNSEISTRICIAEQTTRNYISKIYQKLGVTNRVQIVKMAKRSGFF
jgi:DNA-binding NarL/FixJ family response regulator